MNMEKEMRQEAYENRAYGIFGGSEFRRSYNKFEVQELQKEVGKLIFAEAREEGDTRLFLKRLSVDSDVKRKDGWWDMFTVTDTPCRKGVWSCRINKIRLDRNEWLMMEVTPLDYLGESINSESVAWDYFSRSNIFSKLYTTDHYKSRFNVQEVEERFYSLWKHLDTDETKEEYKKQYIPSYCIPAIGLWRAFCDKKLLLEEVEDALNTPQGFEAMAINLLNNQKEFTEKYPLMMGKIRKMSDGYLYKNDVYDYLFSRYYAASAMQKEGKLDKELEGVFELIEASIAYYAELKKAQKEAKKAARKAKKAQKTES